MFNPPLDSSPGFRFSPLVKPPPDFFEAASEAWQAAMDQKNYDDAVKAGIDAYLHDRAAGNHKLSALGLIHLAIAKIIFGDEPEPPTLSCSFCGLSGPDVRLGAGPEVFICADCVSIFYGELVAKKSDGKEPQ